MSDMPPSRWASGINWRFTIWHPMFFGVQGEVIYSFLIIIYFPSWTLLKGILICIALLLIAKLMGYSVEQLGRRWNRWRLGKGRPVYNLAVNKRRFLSGM